MKKEFKEFSDVELPLPKNGKFYTEEEVDAFIAAYEELFKIAKRKVKELKEKQKKLEHLYNITQKLKEDID